MANNVEVNENDISDLGILSDFELLLILKRQLLNISEDSLRIVYSDIDSYAVFVAIVTTMINEENAFLFLSPDFRIRIREILEIHRFDNEKYDLIKYINGITLSLNEIDNYSPEFKSTVINDYMSDHESIRHRKYSTLQEFGEDLSADYAVYYTLRGAIKANFSDSEFISSIYYFLEEFPTIFDNVEFLERTKIQLEEISRKYSIVDRVKRKNSKEAKQLLKCFN